MTPVAGGSTGSMGVTPPCIMSIDNSNDIFVVNLDCDGQDECCAGVGFACHVSECFAGIAGFGGHVSECFSWLWWSCE